VLTHGERSRYAHWFAIEWTASGSGPGRRRVVLPILGDDVDRVIERGELSLKLSDSGEVRLAYFEHSFPLDPDTLPPELQLVQLDPGVASEALALFTAGAGSPRLRALLEAQHYRLLDWRDRKSTRLHSSHVSIS